VTVRVLEVAQHELDEAIAYYNSQAPYFPAKKLCSSRYVSSGACSEG
jgi:hypothetical protein